MCDIKVLILFYTPEKRVFLGFVPINQSGFVDRLRQVVQQKQSGVGEQPESMPGNRPGAMATNMLRKVNIGPGNMAGNMESNMSGNFLKI